MLSKVIILVLLGACSASLLGKWRDEVKKLSPLKNVQRFSIDVPGLRKELDRPLSPLEGKAQGVLDKLKSSLLLHGAPMGSFKAGAMLPNFVRHPYS